MVQIRVRIVRVVRVGKFNLTLRMGEGVLKVADVTCYPGKFDLVRERERERERESIDS